MLTAAHTFVWLLRDRAGLQSGVRSRLDLEYIEWRLDRRGFRHVVGGRSSVPSSPDLVELLPLAQMPSPLLVLKFFVTSSHLSMAGNLREVEEELLRLLWEPRLLRAEST